MSELPRGWEITSTAEACEMVQSGGTPKAGFIVKNAIPFLKVYNIVDQRVSFEYKPQFVADDVHNGELRKSRIRPGDVLMNIVGPPLGKVAIVPETYPEWNANQALTVFRPSAAVSTNWLYHFLRGGSSVQSVINETRGSAGQVNISLSQCRNFQIPLPPPAEQRRIVAKIDSLTGKSRRARDHLDHIPRLVERYKQAVLAAAFRGDLTQEWRGEDNSKWSDVSLGEVALTLFDGPFGSNLKSSDYTEQGVRVVRLENIGHLTFAEEKRTYISEEKYAGLKRHTLRANDILVSSFVADEMRVCLFPSHLDAEAINKADCFCIRPNRKLVSPRFVELRLASSDTFKALEKEVHGATRPRISLSQLRQLSFRLPSMEEQVAVVRRVETLFTWIDRLATEATSSRRLIDRLDQAVLAKAFRGELVPQDPEDEPASALLERIRAERGAAPNARRGRKATTA
jgi:type I restriction enzyme S subunit